jgi:hypothetical protein
MKINIKYPALKGIHNKSSGRAKAAAAVAVSPLAW